MNIALATGGILIIVLALAHSYLGERLLLSRLFRHSELPRLLGSTTFARRTLRFAWHLTTILMVGIGAAVLLLSTQVLESQTAAVLRIFSVMFACCGVLSLGGARGRHFSWYVFFAIAALCWIGAS
ncbi:MAG: hypothetical protein GY906_21135 [bacterium]|nr:hypothetical protein [bacterium]